MVPQALKRAFKDREITLYLGAGVSMPSGLPSWDRLVLTMYLAALEKQNRKDIPLNVRHVFPNYLEAIAEWQLGTNVDPAEITAQKIRSMVQNDAGFVRLLKKTLYKPIQNRPPMKNSTLKAVKKLSSSSSRGVRAIVNYNYDDLVERDSSKFTPCWRPGGQPAKKRIPVFHVHGFLPEAGDGSTYDELILTEEQFHAAASDPYSWSNLVQMRQLGSNVGLMVGMSLTDRNLRRILEAMRKLPDLCPQFAILKKEQQELSDDALIKIEDAAKRNGRNRKVEFKEHDQIRAIYRKLVQFDRKMKTRVLKDLGVQVLWVDDHDKIPQLFDAIKNA